MLNKILLQDRAELFLIEEKIKDYNKKKIQLEKVINETRINLDLLHEKKESVLAAGDVNSLAELKKLDKSIKTREEELNTYSQMLKGMTNNFMKNISADLKALTVENKKRREKECAEIQAELKEQFEELIYKQWKIYNELVEVENSYKYFNRELVWLFEELGIDISRENNPEIFKIFEYPNIKPATTVLYDCQNLVFKGFTPGPTIERFMRDMAEKLEVEK